MRIILILIVLAAIFVVVQSQRHDCKWGEPGWFDCVIGRTAEAPTPAPYQPMPTPTPSALQVPTEIPTAGQPPSPPDHAACGDAATWPVLSRTPAPLASPWRR